MSEEKVDQEAYDVTIDNHGSVVMVTPVTQEAKQWVDDHVQLEAWQWLGKSFACEPRLLDNLVAGMEDDGLTIGGV